MSIVFDLHKSWIIGNQHGGSKPCHHLRLFVESLSRCPIRVSCVSVRSRKTCLRVPSHRSGSFLLYLSRTYLSDLHTPILSADTKSLKLASKNPNKNPAKSVNSSQNRRSHCIEAIFFLHLLGGFKKSADKVGARKSGLS